MKTARTEGEERSISASRRTWINGVTHSFAFIAVCSDVSGSALALFTTRGFALALALAAGAGGAGSEALEANSGSERAERTLEVVIGRGREVINADIGDGLRA